MSSQPASDFDVTALLSDDAMVVETAASRTSRKDAKKATKAAKKAPSTALVLASDGASTAPSKRPVQVMMDPQAGTTTFIGSTLEETLGHASRIAPHAVSKLKAREVRAGFLWLRKRYEVTIPGFHAPGATSTVTGGAGDVSAKETAAIAAALAASADDKAIAQALAALSDTKEHLRDVVAERQQAAAPEQVAGTVPLAVALPQVAEPAPPAQPQVLTSFAAALAAHQTPAVVTAIPEPQPSVPTPPAALAKPQQPVPTAPAHDDSPAARAPGDDFTSSLQAALDTVRSTEATPAPVTPEQDMPAVTQEEASRSATAGPAPIVSQPGSTETAQTVPAPEQETASVVAAASDQESGAVAAPAASDQEPVVAPAAQPDLEPATVAGASIDSAEPAEQEAAEEPEDLLTTLLRAQAPESRHAVAPGALIPTFSHGIATTPETAAPLAPVEVPDTATGDDEELPDAKTVLSSISAQVGRSQSERARSVRAARAAAQAARRQATPPARSSSLARAAARRSDAAGERNRGEVGD